MADTWQKVQQNRLSDHVKKLASSATMNIEMKTGPTSNEKKKCIRPDAFYGRLDTALERDMHEYAAEQALDALDAY